MLNILHFALSEEYDRELAEVIAQQRAENEETEHDDCSSEFEFSSGRFGRVVRFPLNNTFDEPPLNRYVFSIAEGKSFTINSPSHSPSLDKIWSVGSKRRTDPYRPKGLEKYFTQVSLVVSSIKSS